MHVDDLRDHPSDQRKEEAFDRLSEEAVLHRRPAHDRRQIDRLAAAGHRCHVEDRKVVVQRVEAGVVSERAFEPALAREDVALENDFRLRRHRHVDRLRVDERYAFTAHEPREQELRDSRGQRRDPREHR